MMARVSMITIRRRRAQADTLRRRRQHLLKQEAHAAEVAEAAAGGIEIRRYPRSKRGPAAMLRKRYDGELIDLPDGTVEVRFKRPITDDAKASGETEAISQDRRVATEA